MRLYVYLLEGKEWAVEDSYVKLKLGKLKSKTRVLKNTKNPIWNEEFVFRVNDLEEELVLSVYQHRDDSGFLNVHYGDFVGKVKIPVWSVAAEENQNLPPTWFSLQKPKSAKSVNRDCGKILLTLSFHGKGKDVSTNHVCYVNPTNDTSRENEVISKSSQDLHGFATHSKKISEGKHLMKNIACHFEKLFGKNEEAKKSDEEESKKDDSSDISTTASDYEDCLEESPVSHSFEEVIERMRTTSEDKEMPGDLHGGVLLDQTYVASSKDLNMLLFAPDSQFRKDLAELQGTTDMHEGPWSWKSDELCLTRVVTYMKAASKLVKAVQATEEQTYVKADGKEFSVFVSVSTPDVPYGSTFKIELLYKIMPGQQESSGEESARLVVSWAINFSQNTMMKSMIEGGARQGLKESFDQFAEVLARKLKVTTSKVVLEKDRALASLQTEHQSDWELAKEYFWNFTVVSTIFMVLYVLVHIILSEPSKLHGLEYHGFDLPDSVGEFITSGILVLQLERVYNMVSRFVEARLRRGNDHGVKAQGDGWVLTVALIEGVNLASLDPTGFPDPYVVFTCNGKTRTSSVQLQTLDPQWSEMLEFDAAEEPPSVLDVEVFDFDGPFDQASSLGHAEINFLKHTSAELADIWVPLEGKTALSSQSKLHLRIYLDNNNGVETIRDYLTKMEKEVGKKLNVHSPHKNSTFQKIFGLPPEEFLINDYSCSLKRKMPLQGRIFLSARIVGFYANLFGHKTKFFFLWEDIEDVNVVSPSWSTMWSPALIIILRKGRGVDVRHGARYQDEGGRLHFCFHSFVSFNVASRTIMALWRTRTLPPDQKAELVEVQQENDEKLVLSEDTASYLVVEDVQMSKVYSAELLVSVKSLMQMFDGGDLEHRVMSKSGCLNYVTTSWETVALNVSERLVSYKFNRFISVFGGEVTSTQQKSPIANDSGWTINEIMALHDVPFGDHFRVQFRYEIKDSTSVHNSCKCDVSVGVMWLKNTKFEQRITRNVVGKFTTRLKDILELVEREILLSS
ncbi:C2 and GRAM domain-containing protein At5g50170 [Nicotiana tabacum]|uniref:C2 and GRAM domain-containing protein At5g50170 n=2 Tax=Nicotiana TaxID=4085 RepID=A0A1S4BBQ1_TOBAC|nr:PREDICTED: C2 and GRAM domain-containing protein At5g50170 isoform X2 [Nicotiana sylvestris]XP_016486297.1 PREDICTED: C2 and GRAM domain-containing protein At5g50170-like isoform X2 [Nicotiana tabacum]